MTRLQPPPPHYSEEDVQQALASVYALLLRAARRQRQSKTHAAVEAPRASEDGHDASAPHRSAPSQHPTPDREPSIPLRCETMSWRDTSSPDT
jgi:hypothetical protein